MGAKHSSERLVRMMLVIFQSRANFFLSMFNLEPSRRINRETYKRPHGPQLLMPALLGEHIWRSAIWLIREYLESLQRRIYAAALSAYAPELNPTENKPMAISNNTPPAKLHRQRPCATQCLRAQSVWATYAILSWPLIFGSNLNCG